MEGLGWREVQTYLGRRRARDTWDQSLGMGRRWWVSGIGPSVRRRIMSL